ncbi:MULTISPECIES: phosphatase PAP2 family protein [unclassified Mesorhizobium]|uniref:phosphatase PAP2 family protein n=1 Tax=unclassified Mesorhizobium TaxID=325217 RepID=UPI000FE9F390|nr:MULTISPECIES: phosphatase PAP2 family protein [unclassified Mesorhizobium]RWC78206.1 MAG: phosphatase PAP2 family protein [Mesorhizobium sp.]TGS47684.1 phosphatase PAP2 family protein [Mesorhizobium sp. M8A.F.Ca.ET.182.01.1.1]TGS84026.1 phosphatase PAP2 family protein [Mesorhizobium sp. M8A.F.Ca.ET.181.01.1.1]TIS98440.1 MAG: phosphatase PAP2 family protein [Mesorhizobium sp.]TIW90321.1 MAG: phosphatase PAP2 family protein [Mesorhizobium sp.]
MRDISETLGRQPGASASGAFLHLLAESFYRHRAIHAVALFTLGLSFMIGARVGNRPDFGLLVEYGFYLGVYSWVVGCVYAAFRLLWLAIVDGATSPLRLFLNSFWELLSDRRRIANGVNGLVAIMAFISGFTVLKGAIALLAPFSWDQAFAQFSVGLHFGRPTYQWVWWIVESPLAVHFLNLCYNLWFVVLLSAIFSSVAAARDSLLRHQFLLSFMLVWLIGGFGIALIFSSAGPCYYARLGLGDLYQPLMDALQSANRQYPIWALSLQDRLWDGYQGLPSGSMGISAFPSMHVASAVLIALYATRLSVSLGTLMWIFAVLIMLGSVVLGWHYAIDGYAGALIALAIWKITGAALSRADARTITVLEELSGLGALPLICLTPQPADGLAMADGAYPRQIICGQLDQEDRSAAKAGSESL